MSVTLPANQQKYCEMYSNLIRRGNNDIYIVAINCDISTSEICHVKSLAREPRLWYP